MIIDDGVFRVESELDGWNERLMVFCDDPQGAAQALAHASPRLQRVLWDGRELNEGEWQASGLQHASAANRGGTRLAHPIDLTQACEYVSEPTLHPDGASIYMDTNSELGRRAAATFFAIIREELLAEGIDCARLAEHDG
jgi:hypothetical protein